MTARKLAAVATALALTSPAAAAVQVAVGPTTIPGGEASAGSDITVSNDRLAFAIAVDTPAPYGVPKGAIIDVAAVRDGRIEKDHAVFADFIPNNWSAWPNTFQKVEILERGPKRAVIRAVRDFGQATVSTTYTLEDGADVVEIATTMTNGGTQPMKGLLSGPTLWPEGGFLFGVPGTFNGDTGGKNLADRAVAYDADWSIALHVDGFDHVAYAGKDLYRRHDLAPGESRTFVGRLQVGARGDLAPVIAEEIAHKKLPAAVVRGKVRDQGGKPVAEPVVVVEKDSKPYGWAFGRNGAYSLTLPAGEYRLYATGAGYSQSNPFRVTLAANGAMPLDFEGLGAPGTVNFAVADPAGAPLDARIAITQGQKPLVEFLGKKTFFTELDRKGAAQVSLAPGAYRFAVSSGGGFLSERQELAVEVKPGEAQNQAVTIVPMFAPAAKGWVSADLHHHADQAEAGTPPPDLARSQLAAGLDVLFVSDHDSAVNHAALAALAAKRGVGFIPSIELSASWAHFNAYPLAPGAKLAIDTGTATSSQILAEARRLGAVVIQANHPFIPYGYLASAKAGLAPGGFDPAFDVLEINAATPFDDGKVLKALWDFWNEGKRYYLAGGTDAHDVWNEESGRERTFAHVADPRSAEAFAQAVKAGHAYVSAGPLVFPSVMFGETLKVKAGEVFTLGFDLQSVAGLKSAQLIGSGMVVETRTFRDGPREARAEFALKGGGPGWYALTVEDRQGRKAYANPIWVSLAP